MASEKGKGYLSENGRGRCGEGVKVFVWPPDKSTRSFSCPCRSADWAWSPEKEGLDTEADRNVSAVPTSRLDLLFEASYRVLPEFFVVAFNPILETSLLYIVSRGIVTP